MNSIGDEIKSKANKLVKEAYQLLSETIEATREADEKARKHGVDWTKRHRLWVLLEAAENARKGLVDTVPTPWFLVELETTLDIVRRWRKRRFWRELEPSLAKRTHFRHTILKLLVADHLEQSGHRVHIVPRSDQPSPDLMLHAIGGTQDLVSIECYQPSGLSARPSSFTDKEAKTIVKKSMEKAKRQIGSRIPGLLAICGYNQSQHNLEVLRRAAEERLQKTSRTNLCGICLVMLGVVVAVDKGRKTLTLTKDIDFLRNPSYFGRVDIDSRTRSDHPQLIEGPFSEVGTDVGYFKAKTAVNISSARTEEAKNKTTKELKLDIISEPEELSMSIVHGVGSKVPPLFVGEGTVNYLCGQCGVALAKQIWALSVSNVVIECPGCQCHNEFPTLSNTNYDRVLLSKGNYSFSDVVRLRRGVQLVGQ